MLLIFLLMLTFSNAEHQTLCTSSACFTLHLDAVSFTRARLNCHDNGGYLMTIRNSEEEDVLRTLLSQTPQQEKPFKIHIGLKVPSESCVISNGALRGFKWVSGEEDSQYSNWKSEPKRTCNERCVSVTYNPTAHNHMKWIDGSCSKSFSYVCKFIFKGMCKALMLSGPGKINYTAPFSKKTLKKQMKSLPVGTIADIICSDQEPFYSVCTNYSWSKSGPFCQTNRSCATKNGGCEHVCNQEEGKVTCSCNDGYELNEDGLSCGLTNMCYDDTCQYQCIMGETGFTCLCPQGFELNPDQRTCSDIDECQLRVCGEHLCVNTEGGYTCNCEDGYEMVGGECRDVNECVDSRCAHVCLNSMGSFFCQCYEGFELSEDGRSCKDIDECKANICKFECVNIPGTFLCACPNGYQVDRSGECFPNTLSSKSLSESSTVKETQENFTESSSSLVELQHKSPHTNASLPTHNITHSRGQADASLATGLSKANNSRVMICVLGSVIPLVVLVAITLGILVVRCGQVKKEAKKNTTTDGYCWVSSGLDPRLEKLYESIPTDDL